jgi:hypothetical protein
MPRGPGEVAGDVALKDEAPTVISHSGFRLGLALLWLMLWGGRLRRGWIPLEGSEDAFAARRRRGSHCRRLDRSLAPIAGLRRDLDIGPAELPQQRRGGLAYLGHISARLRPRHRGCVFLVGGLPE